MKGQILRILHLFKLFMVNGLTIIRNINYFSIFIYVIKNKINIFEIRREHIGHYPINLFFSKMKYGVNDIYIYDNTRKNNVNAYLDHKIEEIFNFDQRYENVYKIIYAVSKLSMGKFSYNKFTDYNKFSKSLGKNTGIANLFARKEKLLDFNDEENCRGIAYLQKHGISPERYVCIHVRDQEYFNRIKKNEREKYNNSFRNINPSSYLMAVDYLVELGYHVIRMGKGFTNSFPYSSPKFIDYAVSNDRDDFLDIWLTANCRYFLSSSSGIGELPIVFHTPFIGSNVFPWGRIFSWAPLAVSVPRLAQKNGELLNIKDMIEISVIGRIDGEYYKKMGIEILENEPAEILGAVKDMEDKIQNGFHLSELNVKFWNNMKRDWRRGSDPDWNGGDKHFDIYHDIQGIGHTIPDFYLKKYAGLFIDY